MTQMLNLYEECKILFAERGIEFKDEFVEIVDTLANRMMNNYKDVLGRVDAESQQHFADKKIPLQHNLFCSKSQQSTTTKIEKCFVTVLCIGSVAGAVKGGITCYNSVVRNYSYSDAVATTTLGTLIGFGQGFATVCLSPIIIPIAMMIAVTRYIEQDKNVI